MRPRSRCDTCAKRHAKCGGQRPQCRQCEMHDFRCTWNEKNGKHVTTFRIKGLSHCADNGATETILEFGTACLDSGKAPKGTSNQLAVDSSTIRKPFRHADDRDLRPCDPLIQPRFSLVTLATTKYARRWLQDVKSFPGHEAETFYRTGWRYFMITGKSPQVEFAETAVALAYFGQTEKSAVAMAASYHWYHQVLAYVRSMLGASCIDVSDSTLMIIMLLFQYESLVAKIDRVMPAPYRHSLGAAALIPLRRNRAVSGRYSGLLDNYVRQQAIRSLINTASPVPHFLRDGAQYYHDESHRWLYACMLELADLWAWEHKTELRSPCLARDRAFASITQAAIDLDAKFNALGKSLKCGDRCTLSSPYHMGCFDAKSLTAPRPCDYKRFEFSNYRGARVRLSDIVIRAKVHRTHSVPKHTPLSGILATPGALPIGDDDLAVSHATATLSAAVAAIFASVPSHFGCVGDNMECLEDASKSASPTVSNKLVFALLAICNAFAVVPEDRQKAKQILLLVGRVSGNRTFNQLYGKGGLLAGDHIA